ncbi:hypothetical protein ACGFH8_02165 [Micromonospora sp. NPDC049175]|uniref:hypothetical protein n=1 Tax=Micromonospora sp. NPDC049175 TaxID=3364266 RepID=UPI00371A3B3A
MNHAKGAGGNRTPRFGPDGSPTGGTDHLSPTVPGVGYHAAHTARAWQAVLDVFGESIGAR